MVFLKHLQCYLIKKNNDCVVRAVSHAFDVDYIEAHHFCEMKLHRKSGDGTYTSTLYA